MEKFFGKVKYRLLMWLMNDICKKTTVVFDECGYDCGDCACFRDDVTGNFCPCSQNSVMLQAWRVWVNESIKIGRK